MCCMSWTIRSKSTTLKSMFSMVLRISSEYLMINKKRKKHKSSVAIIYEKQIMLSGCARAKVRSTLRNNTDCQKYLYKYTLSIQCSSTSLQ